MTTKTTVAAAPAARRSLFSEVLDWMLTPLLLLWPISLAITWWVAQGIADQPFDRALIGNALTLAQHIQATPGQPPRLTTPGRELLRGDDSDSTFFQVLGPRGEWLGGQPDLPPPPAPEASARLTQDAGVYLRQIEWQGQSLRVAHTWVPLAGPDGPQALVQVAETRNKRSAHAAEIIKGVMLPQFLALPLAVALIWLAIARGIRPLARLERRIRARASDDLSPLDARAVPLEVGPLVAAINDLLARLNVSMATQKRFLADAAHQLKTPLAGLRMQAEMAQRENASEDELKRSLAQIGRATVRATHTVNQLLALARAEAGGAARAAQPCDLAAIVMEVVREAVPAALQRRIDLGYDGPEASHPGCQILGQPTLLAEMVRNLVENALYYTPSSDARPGVVTARVRAAGAGALTLEVEDNGPGIAADERERVFEPFYRQLGTEVDGSGLGLPIVREIATQHGARVSVTDTLPGQVAPGARFVVRFAPTGPGASATATARAAAP